MVADWVSIHAPLRGATLPTFLISCSKNSFNPRTPAGCDISEVGIVAQVREFQSTHPCGVRRACSKARGCGSERFNPRTPAGCDHIAASILNGDGRFQSTHPCGVRPKLDAPGVYIDEEFQSTHPCGVRLGGEIGSMRFVTFQSTHPCGVRPQPLVFGVIFPCVSIHAPLRGATVWDGSAENAS